MAELTWTAESERWLRDIHDFIAHDNPTAATRTIETLYQRQRSSESSLNKATSTGNDQTDTSASFFMDTTESPT